MSSFYSFVIGFIKVCGFIKLIEIGFRIFQFICRSFRTTEYLASRYGIGTWAMITG